MNIKSERGAVLVMVAVGLLALLALSAFVFDQGAMLSGRRGAQNAADAGALAGAQSLMQRQGNDHARDTARAFAERHRVFDDSPAGGEVTVTVPIGCPPPWNTPDGCIKVDISKQDLPTFFARLVNINSQGVRATATAMVGAGNAVSCIKPWIVADRWTDNSGTGSNPNGWDPDDIFNPGVDVYTPVGFSSQTDVGLQIALKGDRNQWSAGWSLEIELGGGNGGNTYRNEIATCPAYVPMIGLHNPQNPCNSRADTNPEQGCVNVRTGVRQGPTEQGVGDLIALDSGATWDSATNTVSGGCMQSGTCNNPTGVNISPRIVPIAVFDVSHYASSGCSGNNCVARVVNLLGFFIEGMCDQVFGRNTPSWCGTHPREVVIGRMMEYPAQFSGAAGNPGNATFLQTTLLVR